MILINPAPSTHTCAMEVTIQLGVTLIAANMNDNTILDNTCPN